MAAASIQLSIYELYLQQSSGGLRQDGGARHFVGQVLQNGLQPLQVHQHACLHVLWLVCVCVCVYVCVCVCIHIGRRLHYR